MRIASKAGIVLALVPALTLLEAGCGKPDGPPKEGDNEAKEKRPASAREETKHEGWSCDEHGIPEEECIMCIPKLRAAAKKNGDWCEHERAKSQCFACDPKLKEFYAARYRAKYAGKEPPPPEDNE